MRTILEIAQSVAPKIGIATPQMLFSSTDQTAVELASLANELAERIVRAHDWSAIKIIASFAGDGVTASFPVPTDYIRMPKDGQVWSTRLMAPLLHIHSTDDWLRLIVRNFGSVTGAWTILGGVMQFKPALAVAESAQFVYVSGNAIKPATGANKARFTTDTDSFLLGDRLLELHLIWEWRQRKGLSYGEDMATAEAALAQAVSDDGAARTITQRSRFNLSAPTAFPGVIVP